MEIFPTELTSDEEMERSLSEWWRMNVIKWMYVLYNIKIKKNKKSRIMSPNKKKYKCYKKISTLDSWLTHHVLVYLLQYCTVLQISILETWTTGRTAATE